jgi:hypothetical protein
LKPDFKGRDGPWDPRLIARNLAARLPVQPALPGKEQFRAFRFDHVARTLIARTLLAKIPAQISDMVAGVFEVFLAR